jgi:hypothetical protein
MWVFKQTKITKNQNKIKLYYQKMLPKSETLFGSIAKRGIINS